MASAAPGRPRRAVAAAVLAALAAALVWPSSRAFGLVLVALVGLIVVHEGGHLLACRLAGVGAPEFSVGLGPELVSRAGRRTRVVWRALPVGGFVRIKGMTPSGLDAVDGDASAPGASWDDVSWLRRVGIAFAGPLANVVAAFAVLFIMFMGVGVSDPTTKVKPAPGSGAEAAGLLGGDRLVSVAGRQIGVWSDVAPALASAPADGPVEVVVDRAGEQVVLEVTPQVVDGKPRLGVRSLTAASRLGPSDSVRAAGTATWQMAVMSVRGFGSFADAFTGLPSRLASGGGSVESDASRPLSPIGAASIAASSTETQGAAGPLMLLAAASLFLALFNLLPLPPLDGGHIAVACFERGASAVTGRTVVVDQAKLRPVAAVVIVAIMALGVCALLGDIFAPVRL